MGFSGEVFVTAAMIEKKPLISKKVRLNFLSMTVRSRWRTFEIHHAGLANYEFNSKTSGSKQGGLLLNIGDVNLTTIKMCYTSIKSAKK